MALHVRQLAGGVIVCEIDNPAQRNALTTEMIDRLTRVLQGAHNDDAVRFIVVRGLHGTFCSGRAIGELDTGHADAAEAAIAPVTRLAEAFINCPVPTLAVVEGKAVGLGVAMVSWCDMAMAADSATFMVPEARAGVTPTFTAVSLDHVLGRRAALALCLAGQPIDAEAARHNGLVHWVCPAEGIVRGMEQLTESVLQGGPQALRACKDLLGRTAGVARRQAIEMAAATSVAGMGAAEAREGMRAFREKRRPSWTGEER